MKHYVINLDRAPERLAETARLSALAWGGARAVPLSGFAGLLAKAAAAAAFSGAAVLALFRRDLAAARARKSGARRVS